ncbi:Ig-like domain repeat protein [Microbacterium testaceum]|nr:Ig-like domain repeat protein [Microbacterium testaceum]
MLALALGAALVMAPGFVVGEASAAQAAAPEQAAAPAVVSLERSLTITPSTPVKSWTVPAGIAGAIDVTVVGAPGSGRQGGGAAAAFDFSVTRPAGEQWSFLFGAQNARAFASLAGGAGSGLPAAYTGQEEMWAWPWKATRQSGGNGGDATAIIAGTNGARCDSDAEVLAVAAGGGGGSGESRVWSAGSVFTHGAYRGGEPGHDASEWLRGSYVTAAALCSTSGANSRGAEPEGQELIRHAGGGGGGGGVVAGDGGGPDRMIHSFFRDDFASAGGGRGGANYLSPDVCGDCAGRTARASRDAQSITLRWQEKHTPVITADRPNNPLVVRVVSAETGQPLPGTITLGREDGTAIVTTEHGVGEWKIDALAHITDINVIDRSDDDSYIGYENVTIAYTPDVATVLPGRIVHLLESVPAATTVTTQVRRLADGRFLLLARWDAMIGSSAVDLDGLTMNVRANPPRTYDDTVADIPLRTSPSLPTSARCVAIRIDAPDGTDIGMAFRGTDALTSSSSRTYVDATTPVGELPSDCGEPVDLHVDAPPPPPGTPDDEGEWPTGPEWHWSGVEEEVYDTPPSGYQPGKVIIQRTYWTAAGEENRYVAHYYYDNTYAGYATYDHSGWGFALPPLTPGKHTVQTVFTPADVKPGEAVADGVVAPVHTFTVPADATGVTLTASNGSDSAARASTATLSASDPTAETQPVGDPLRLQARVRGAGIEEVDGGVVAFYDDDVLLGHAPVIDSVATLDGIHLDGESNSVRAEYLGLDGLTLPSSSDPQTVSYEETPVEVRVEGLPESIVADAAGQFTVIARATGGDAALSGTMRLLSDQDHELYVFSDADAVPEENGSVLRWTLPLSLLSADTHTFSAEFSGDPGFADGRSAAATSVVQKRPSTLSTAMTDTADGGVGLEIAARIDDAGKASSLAGEQPSGDIGVWAGERLLAEGVVIDGHGVIQLSADAIASADRTVRVAFQPAGYDTAASEVSITLRPSTRSGLAATGADIPLTGMLGTAAALMLTGLGCLVIVVRGRRRRASR